MRRFWADPSLLATVMFASAPALVTARGFDLAARACVKDDRPPLLRLMAETASAVDSRDPSGDATPFSAALVIAVMCQDSSQIFGMRLADVARRIDRDPTIARRIREIPGTYAPVQHRRISGHTARLRLHSAMHRVADAACPLPDRPDSIPTNCLPGDASPIPAG